MRRRLLGEMDKSLDLLTHPKVRFFFFLLINHRLVCVLGCRPAFAFLALLALFFTHV